MYEQAKYLQTYDALIKWYRAERDADNKIRTTSKPLDREITNEAKEKALHIYPSIWQDTYQMGVDSRLVFPGQEDPESFPNSPYARLHSNLQLLRRALFLECFQRGETVAGISPKLQEDSKDAWQEVNALPAVESLLLNAETIRHAFQFLTPERFAHYMSEEGDSVGMWADGKLDEPYYAQWIDALKTGIAPSR